MIYVDVAKPHIKEQIAKLDRIPLPPAHQDTGRPITRGKSVYDCGNRKGGIIRPALPPMNEPRGQ